MVNSALYGEYDLSLMKEHTLAKSLGFDVEIDFSDSEISILELVDMYRPEKEHISICIDGKRGSFKTTHLIAMHEECKKLGLKSVFIKTKADFEKLKGRRDLDIVFIDDIAKYFYKRDGATKINKAFAKILQMVRTVVPLIIATTPDLSLLDKDGRAFFIEAYVLRKGTISVMGINIGVEAPSVEFYSQFKDDEHDTRFKEFDELVDVIFSS
ncbi:hypothetical protein MmarC5_1274 [Methanococcus maripaludis C5]|uniref:Uncharacterized protein n=1 Tax=Methanococcus maripaludis (strain C5 / ATCC BAA-1333) TaxID=402880 RepID=A4FZD8_METM5|nr:hypothetical protein [Methanococcus maripaludis]ABO35572.1 hypothetical protein MmarC5_1274 [Methanococcus maripaludis C5]